ncbi:hypothetical protein JZ751_011608 [Albula glossodonta]|uniref:Uncharacterized protein n=1 Tax=Albula glossodonta TaxID=121402 RepID=A0A8T2NAB2_9TELE|nr:hypothetical protein JZ751_011608 [Albula glossodonta]
MDCNGYLRGVDSESPVHNVCGEAFLAKRTISLSLVRRHGFVRVTAGRGVDETRGPQKETFSKNRGAHEEKRKTPFPSLCPVRGCGLGGAGVGGGGGRGGVG